MTGIKHHLFSSKLNQVKLFCFIALYLSFLLYSPLCTILTYRIPDVSYAHIKDEDYLVSIFVSEATCRACSVYLQMENKWKNKWVTEWVNEEGHLQCIPFSCRILLRTKMECMRKGHCFAPFISLICLKYSWVQCTLLMESWF